jgi:hypothetical protein
MRCSTALGSMAVRAGWKTGDTVVAPTFESARALDCGDKIESRDELIPPHTLLNTPF